MKSLHTEIEINASPEKVWEELTDFESFPEWNPFIRKLEGEVKEGSRIEVLLKPEGGKASRFRPMIRRFEYARELRWLGRLVTPGIFDGEHIFELHKTAENKTRFIHRENFKGLLVPLLWKQLDTEIRKGFNDMNRALKERVEKR